ncbi:hypothetical protein H5158_13295 [Pseudoalteromonas sp. SR45-6]|uniref:hypothetical protein n=1 Tax=Pseudoalteromonas sp. SR45-6 TaxID=2760927 RepID=UPI0016045DE6|nr:hypothetical protein [Pseudoalteromonas sp. SR45-6]MBB1342608.1 hypothetical protein [Pseudoalteromonas sp. SR45-6]
MTNTVTTNRLLGGGLTRINQQFDLGLVTVDVDPAASRLHLVDRLNGNLISSKNVSNQSIVNIIVPVKYSIEPLLYAIIFDDSKNYNATAQDFCIANLVSGLTLEAYESV